MKKRDKIEIDWKRIFIYSFSSAIIVSAIVFSFGIGTVQERINIALYAFIVYFVLTFFGELLRKTKPDNPKGLGLLSIIITPPFFQIEKNK